MNHRISLRQFLPLAGITVSAFLFNTSEFMPIGLLTSIASDFQITEAQAGVMISAYLRGLRSFRLLVYCGSYGRSARRKGTSLDGAEHGGDGNFYRDDFRPAFRPRYRLVYWLAHDLLDDRYHIFSHLGLYMARISADSQPLGLLGTAAAGAR